MSRVAGPEATRSTRSRETEARSRETGEATRKERVAVTGRRALLAKDAALSPATTWASVTTSTRATGARHGGCRGDAHASPSFSSLAARAPIKRAGPSTPPTPPLIAVSSHLISRYCRGRMENRWKNYYRGIRGRMECTLKLSTVPLA